MSKVVAATIATGGSVAVAAVGGAYLMQKGSDVSVFLDADMTKLKDLTTFENEKGGSCVKHVFGSLEFTSKGEEVGKDDNITGIDFSSNTSEEVKSCLVVNWEKKSYSAASGSTDKWKGYFRWVGSFSTGDKGFSIFLTTKENSLNLDGSFYYMERSNDQHKTGSIKKHKKVDSTKSITKDKLSSLLSSAGTSISASLKEVNRNNWGGLAGQDDIQNFCTDTSSCGSGTGTNGTFKESWLGTKGGSTKGTISTWMNDFDTLFKEIFKGETLKLDGFAGSGNKFTPLASTSVE